ncbi:hypothetical protein K4F52_000420 [Lecanicillium sp. MT-2017a]|nr:hypothetical protein K4F52_000420 [Lecanicillium sp. MT-2017a]
MTSRRRTSATPRDSAATQRGKSVIREAVRGRHDQGSGHVRERIADLSCRFASPLSDYLCGFLAPAGEYNAVRAALLHDGYVAAVSLMLAAVLVNHIRRILVPWLGQFLWWHPVEAMKMAKGSPHYFLLLQLRLDNAALGRWLLQMAALALCRRELRRYLASGQHRRRRAAVAMDACCILHLALCLADLEAAYAESCWAGAWLYATGYIWLRGSSAQRSFALKLLWEPWEEGEATAQKGRGMTTLAMVVVGLLLLRAGWRTTRPFRTRGLGVAVSALAVFWGLLGAGTVHVVRYSNKYFIWLEMTDMLLTWLWMGLAVGVVVSWWWSGHAHARLKAA